MTTYEEELQAVVDEGIVVHENYYLGNGSAKPGHHLKGLYCNGHIALSDDLESTAEQRCILAEEYAHAVTSTGSILDQTIAGNRKQERVARGYSYDRLFGIEGIANALRSGCKSYDEAAEYLEVTEEVLKEAVCYYHDKYGCYVEMNGYDLYFEPYLFVLPHRGNST